MNRKKIYLFACIEKNIGDDLFIYTVANRYKNVDFIISSDADYLKINKICNLKYSKNLKHWLKYANKENNKFFKRIIIDLLEMINRIKLQKLDSIYIVGNAFKNMNYQGKFQIKWLEKRLKLSKKFYLLSTNFGPYNDERWKNDCVEIFTKMEDVCFRDLKSFELFKNLNNVRYAPDAIITNDFFNNKINDDIQKKYVIISTIDCKFTSRSNKLKQIANSYENKMVEIINHINEHGLNVIILNSNTLQDLPASTRIFNNCSYKNNIKIYNYDGNLNDIFNLYKNARAVIGTRLHTIILAWLYKIPVVPIIYDIKVKNLLSSYNFDGLSKEIDDLDDLKYIDVEQAIKNYSFELSSKLKLDAEQQFRKVDKLLS